MTAILILNWNGFKDTIECIKSLLAMDTEEFWIVVGDNGSTNGSVAEISEYLAKEKIHFHTAELGNTHNLNLGKKDVVLLEMTQNHGFSKGNNLMIEFIAQYKPQNYLLLNNDTTVEPDFLSKLVEFKNNNSSYKVLTPLIYYFSNPTMVWNAGGKLQYGFNKYHYAKQIVENKNLPDSIKCTFITGCALFFGEDLLMGTKLFTEKFFFGEEDFEFSMRMKRQNVKMACVTSSVIYHKVSASSKKVTNLNKVFIHYLNRFINLKDFLNPIQYRITILAYKCQIFRYLQKTGHPMKEIMALLRHLSKESSRLNGVSKVYFEKVWYQK